MLTSRPPSLPSCNTVQGSESSVPAFSADGSLLRREKDTGGWGDSITDAAAAAAAGGGRNSTLEPQNGSTSLLRLRREKPRRTCFPGQFSVNGIVRRGLYAYQLEHWLRFFPPEQMLVLNHEQVWLCGGCVWLGGEPGDFEQVKQEQSS